MRNAKQTVTLAFLFLTFLSCSLGGESLGNRFDRELMEESSYFLQEGDSYSYFRRSYSGDRMDFKGFYGRETLYRVVIQQETTLNLTVELTLKKKGYFCLALVEPLQEKVTILAQTTTKLDSDIRLPQGTYEIKMVGYAVSGTIDMHCQQENE
jgi:hypothetical protein